MNGGWLRHYSWRCQPVDTSTSENGLRVSVKVTSNMAIIMIIADHSPLKPYLSHFPTGSTWLLRLLHRQAHRTARHDLLRPAEKG